jgi:hypothetical protein
VQKIYIITLIVLFSLKTWAVITIDPLKFKCSEERVRKLQNSLEDFRNGIKTNGRPAIDQLRRQLLLTKDECGNLRFDPNKMTDKELKDAIQNPPKALIMKASSSSGERSNFLSACFLFFNLLVPDPMLTGCEPLPVIVKEHVGSSSSAGSGTNK